MTVLEPISWALAAVVAYTFLGYPLAIRMLAWLSPNTIRRSGRFDGSFSIVVSAHNEERDVRRRLVELTALARVGRPLDSIILVSDGSTDLTATQARTVGGVTVIELPVRRGKAMALNAAAAASNADVLIFGDVRQHWAADAVERLLENFSDPRIGGVSGDLELEARGNGTIRGFGLYWRFEKWLRCQESLFHSSVGVTGAISGVRRVLFPVLPEGTVLDDVYWPMVVVAKGYRVVHDARAVAFDSSPPRVIDEFRRKVRTLAGNYQLLRLLPGLLLPWRNPLWLQFASHKVSRLAAPWMLLSLLSLTGLLVHIPYQRAAFVMQMVGYLYACLALEPRLGRRLPFGETAASFVVANVAAFIAFWVWLLGGTAGVWRKVSYAPVGNTLAPHR